MKRQKSVAFVVIRQFALAIMSSDLILENIVAFGFFECETLPIFAYILTALDTARYPSFVEAFLNSKTLFFTCSIDVYCPFSGSMPAAALSPILHIYFHINIKQQSI